jgi:hypothetical protein
MIRGGIAVRMGSYAQGLSDIYTAFEISEGPRSRESALCDIAAVLMTMGQYYETAMNAQAYLVRYGTSPYVRLVSVINLLEICVLYADELPDAEQQFQHWWKVFLEMECPMPEMRMQGWLNYAIGVERWEPQAAAISAYQDVIARAKTAGIHRVVSRAEDALHALLRPESQTTRREILPVPKQRPPSPKSRTALIARNVNAFCLEGLHHQDEMAPK